MSRSAPQLNYRPCLQIKPHQRVFRGHWAAVSRSCHFLYDFMNPDSVPMAARYHRQKDSSNHVYQPCSFRRCSRYKYWIAQPVWQIECHGRAMAGTIEWSRYHVYARRDSKRKFPTKKLVGLRDRYDYCHARYATITNVCHYEPMRK